MDLKSEETVCLGFQLVGAIESIDGWMDVQWSKSCGSGARSGIAWPVLYPLGTVSQADQKAVPSRNVTACLRWLGTRLSYHQVEDGEASDGLSQTHS